MGCHCSWKLQRQSCTVVLVLGNPASSLAPSRFVERAAKRAQSFMGKTRNAVHALHVSLKRDCWRRGGWETKVCPLGVPEKSSFGEAPLTVLPTVNA